MKLKGYQSSNDMLSALREGAINAISCILNDWDGYTNKQKIAAIDGVINFLAGLEMNLVEEKKDEAT